jgi:GT2 family glycosyltransferase
MPEPFVSVAIVNYNGAHYLPACLDGLRRQTYPAGCFEVIVSDNGSRDGSLELLRSRYPWVRLLANPGNLGFAAGNNVAIEAARGEYVVLLNNDTVPEPDWLENLVRVAGQHPDAGLVTGRLQLFYDQLILELETDAFVPGGDGRSLGVQVFSVDPGVERGVVQYLAGFYGREPGAPGESFRWTQAAARLGLPVPPGDGDWEAILYLAAARPGGEPVPVRVSAGDGLAQTFAVSGSRPRPYRLRLPAEARARAQPLVQNTGAVFFRNATTRDRGTYVENFEVFFETDEGQYGRVEEVFAGCGANLLLRRAMLDQIGKFDEDFFMYYEDTDLSWRARLLGWKVLYAPGAVVRHIHCGTSEEWSPFFVFHVERNHLAMLFKNGSPRQILSSWGRYLGSGLKSLLSTCLAFLARRDWRARARRARQQGRVLASLAGWLPALWRQRRWIQANRRVSAADVAAWYAD